MNDNRWFHASFQSSNTTDIVTFCAMLGVSFIIVISDIVDRIRAVVSTPLISFDFYIVLFVFCLFILLYKLFDPKSCKICFYNDGLMYKTFLFDPVIVSWEETRSILIQDIPYSNGQQFSYKRRVIITRKNNGFNIFRRERRIGSRKIFYLDYSIELVEALQQCYPDEIIMDDKWHEGTGLMCDTV